MEIGWEGVRTVIRDSFGNWNLKELLVTVKF
jgi:hypothetical protein